MSISFIYAGLESTIGALSNISNSRVKLASSYMDINETPLKDLQLTNCSNNIMDRVNMVISLISGVKETNYSAESVSTVYVLI